MLKHNWSAKSRQKVNRYFFFGPCCMADLLRLLYEGGDKTKPLSPMVTNEKGEPVGRNLGFNHTKDISEWAGMVFFLAGKNNKSDEHDNCNCRKFICRGCGSTLQTSMLFPFILLYLYALFFYVLIFCLS